MEIKLNENPVYSKSILDVLEANVTSLGLEDITPEDIEKERENIDNGNPSKRCPEDVKCYDIYLDNNQLVGSITLTDITENEIELAIIMYVQNRGYGSEALEIFLKDYKHNYDKELSVIVRKGNPKYEFVKSFFYGRGFVFSEELSSGSLLKFDTSL